MLCLFVHACVPAYVLVRVVVAVDVHDDDDDDDDDGVQVLLLGGWWAGQWQLSGWCVC